MPSFDMITAARNAYQTTWSERRYLLRMALIPLLVKYICYVLSVLYVEPDNLIRVALVMLPSYFVEGWLLAHWSRTIVLGHRWPFKPSGDARADLLNLAARGRGILSGMVVFVLINFVMAGYFAFFTSYIPLDTDPKNADPAIAIVGIVMIITSFFGFRFVWSYIPLALNFPISSYIKGGKPASLTISMIGLWLICFVPVIMVMQVFGSLIMGAAGEGDLPAPLQGVLMFMRVALDMVKNLLCTAGMAYAFIEIFKWKKLKEKS